MLYALLVYCRNSTVHKTINYPTLPCNIRILEDNCVEMEICEGRQHQIRNMFKLLGYRVVKLHRISYGSIQLGNLPVGGFQVLRASDIV